MGFKGLFNDNFILVGIRNRHYIKVDSDQCLEHFNLFIYNLVGLNINDTTGRAVTRCSDLIVPLTNIQVFDQCHTISICFYWPNILFKHFITQTNTCTFDFLSDYIEDIKLNRTFFR